MIWLIRPTKAQLRDIDCRSTFHWIGVHLEGQPIGAVVSVVQGEKRQFLPIVTGDSFDAQHANTVHFGIGKTESVDALEVQWPNGKTTRVTKPAIDRYHLLRP